MLKLLYFLFQLFYHSYIQPAGPFFTENDYPELKGQKWVITGATGGIGLAVSEILLKQHAEIWIVGRNEEKLEATRKTLQQKFPNAKIHIVKIDYNDLTTVKPGIQTIKNETNQLHGIIHNAGVMFVPKDAKTKQGHEMTVGVNNLATQLVQDLLDPLIENTPNGRIVWLSSVAQIGAPKYGFDLNKIKFGSTIARYCISKALDYILAVQWSLRHPESTVKSVAVHPGVIKSDLTRYMSPISRRVFESFQWDTVYGARTVITAALDPKIANNEYVVPFGRAGLVRPDISRGARSEPGYVAVKWVEENINNFK